MIRFQTWIMRAVGSIAALVATGLAVPANEHRLSEPIPPAELVADFCSTEWLALTTNGPQLVAMYRSTLSEANLGDESPAAVQRVSLLASIILANQGAFLAWMSTASEAITDEDWRVQEEEHDLETQWTRGRANFDLLDCLWDVSLSEIDVVETWIQVVAPTEISQDTVTREIEYLHAALEDYACYLGASRVLFEQNYGREPIVAAFNGTILPMLDDCDD